MADRPLHDRIPPQSLEMEQALLGSMLVERPAIEKAVDAVQPDDFYRDAHRVIYEAITALYSRDEPVDLLTLQEQLRSVSSLERIGGAPYLVELTDAVPTAANVEHYARVVQEKALLRRLIDAANQVNSLAHSEYDTIDDVVDQAERAVFAVAQRRSTSYFTPMKDLVWTVFDQVEARSNSSDPVIGVATPFDKLNYMTAGLQPSDLIIIAARPSMGKTSLALGMAQEAAIRSGLPVAIFSLEMAKEQLCLRVLCSEAEVDAHRLRTGSIDTAGWQRVGETCNVLSSAPIFIDDSTDCSVLEMRSRCRRLKAEQRGLGLELVDYLQLMRGHRNNDNRVQEITDIARGLKSLARELQVPVVALSQLSRAVESRQDKHPMLSDLRESGSIEAEADVVIFIYRDAYYQRKELGASGGPPDANADSGASGDEMEETELIIAKHRNGPTGVVKVGFLPRFAQFRNLDRDYDDQV
jgi:replicative DNA helicase